MNDMAESRVTRVVGPLVQLDGATSLAMADVVRLGPAGLPGEVVAIRDGIATIQAYEYTGGLRPGDPARSRWASRCRCRSDQACWVVSSTDCFVR